MSRTPLENFTLQPDKKYTFYLVDSSGCILETLPDEHHAHTVHQWYIENGKEVHIEVEHRPELKGFSKLGRDPDLH